MTEGRTGTGSRPGLSTVEAHRRLVDVGPNEIPPPTRVSPLSGTLAQLRDPMIMVLLAACALTLLTGDFADAAVIGLVVVANTAVGVAQEIRADHAIAALAQLSTPKVRVRRDGVEQALPASTLVPDDVVLLAEGDVVPADCLVLDSSALLVDESALTGESVAVAKSRDLDGGAGRLSAGTVVVKGRAEACVVATGPDSALGRIAALLASRAETTPLQRRLAALGRVLALVAVACSAAVFLLGLVRGLALEPLVITAVSLAVAAVPESLPAVVTMSLALGARRMAARNAVVRRLPAVETLGSVGVLATDKTGTLTEARMVPEVLWTPTGTTAVTRAGELLTEDGPLDLEGHAEVGRLLTAVVLCNDARLTPEEGDEAGLGDPTEVALLLAGAHAGLRREELEQRFPRAFEKPFDAVRQQMTTAHRLPDRPDSVLVVSKGSVEALHRRAPASDDEAWARAEQEAADLAGRGLRVLAVTAGTAPTRDWERAEQHLLGLVAMRDPAKPAARTTIAECRNAGIIPVLITGDHPDTARAIAIEVGVVDPEQAHRPGTVVTGAELADADEAAVTGARVFARTTPEQKVDIVRAWQHRGGVVAMTGDGVNDGPALRRAHIGVAMGGRGTEVARQAADLVLADDALETVVAAVEEGRRVYANIRMFLLFGLAGGAAEILVMLLGPFLGLTVPLLAAQILWVNLLTHGLTGVAMGAEPVAPGSMRRPPIPADQSVLGDGLWQRVLVTGAVLTVAALGVGVWGAHHDRAWQTMLFLALTSLQLGVAQGLRPRQLTRENPFLPLAMLGSLALALLGVYLPVLQRLLGTEPLPAADAALAVGVAAVGWVAVRLLRLLHRHTTEGRPVPVVADERP